MAPAGAPPALWPAGWRDADVLWGAVYGEGPGYVALFSGRRPTPAAKLAAPREAYFRWPGERPAALRWASAARRSAGQRKYASRGDANLAPGAGRRPEKSAAKPGPGP